MTQLKITQMDYISALDSAIQVQIESPENEQLKQIEYLYIAQRYDIFTTSDTCEEKNIYFAYTVSDLEQTVDIKKTKPLLKIQAETECGQRYTLPSSCRGYEMTIKQNINATNQKQLINMSRNYRFSFLCFNRPQITITNSITNKELGYAVNSFCSLLKSVDIFDCNNQLIFQIKSQWNQCQSYITLPCDYCKIITFQIFNKNNKIIAKIKKYTQKRSYCYDCLINSESEYSVQLPKLLPYDEKMLILGGLFFLNHNYYEEKYSDMCCQCVAKCCCSQCIE